MFVFDKVASFQFTVILEISESEYVQDIFINGEETFDSSTKLLKLNISPEEVLDNDPLWVSESSFSNSSIPAAKA